MKRQIHFHLHMPPVVAGISLLASLAINYFLPGLKLIYPPYHFSGIIVGVSGIILIIWSRRVFKMMNTTVNPSGKPTALLVVGPFRISRNPMYLGMSLVILGIAVFIGTAPLFLAPLAFILIMNAVFVPREERKLEEIFGGDFLNYRKKVRRWF